MPISLVPSSRSSEKYLVAKEGFIAVLKKVWLILQVSFVLYKQNKETVMLLCTPIPRM